VIRVFLSHSSADLALTEGAIKLLSGFQSGPPLKLLRARIELPDDVDSFASRISALQRESEFFVFVLFSRNWKITNAVRLARRLADVRPKSAVLCEKEFGADARNLEPFSGFDLDLVNFAPEQLSARIGTHLDTLRSRRKLPDTNGAGLFPETLAKQFSEIEDRADAELAGDDEPCPLEAETFLANTGLEASALPSIQDLMAATGQTQWDPEIDLADDLDIDPGVVAAMRRLAEKGYGLEDQDIGFTTANPARPGASSGAPGQTGPSQLGSGQPGPGKSGRDKS
jgi:hypothetical protein